MRKGIVARSITGLLLACTMLVFTGCFTLLGLLLSEDEPVESKPTEQTDDDYYVLEGSESHQGIIKEIEAGDTDFSYGGVRDLLETPSDISVTYKVSYQPLDGEKYNHKNVELKNGGKYLSSDFYLKVFTFDVVDGNIQGAVEDSSLSSELKKYIEDVFIAVLDESKLENGAITCVFRNCFEAGDFLARGRYYDQQTTAWIWGDCYSYRFTGLEYLPAFTTLTEEKPPVEVTSKYKTFKVRSVDFTGFVIGPDDWRDTYEEGYNPFLRTWDSAETGYNEHGLYDVVDSWKKLSRYNLGDTYAMSLKLKSKGDGFYVTEGGWKVYSTNRQNTKALDDAWNSSSKTVSSYGLCYSMGLVPAGENKYELVLYARTRT